MKSQTKTITSIVLNQEHQILMLRRYPRIWHLPSGIVDDDEANLGAACRIVYETTGIDDLSPIKKATEDHLAQDTNLYFIFLSESPSIDLYDPYILEAKWFSYGDALKRTRSAAEKRFIAASKKYIEPS